MQCGSESYFNNTGCFCKNETPNNTFGDSHRDNGFKVPMLWGLFLGLLAFLTAVGNILVLHAIRTEKRLHTVGNLFILSLAIADMVVGAIVMPFAAIYLVQQKWIFGRVFCQIWLAIDYTASTASIFNLVILSLDRYWSITNPLGYLYKRTRKRAAILICVNWLGSACWVIPITCWHLWFNGGEYITAEDQCDVEYATNRYFKVVTAVLNFYVPLLVMFCLYGKIFCLIRKRNRTFLRNQNTKSSTNTGSGSGGRRLTKKASRGYSFSYSISSSFHRKKQRKRLSCHGKTDLKAGCKGKELNVEDGRTPAKTTQGFDGHVRRTQSCDNGHVVSESSYSPRRRYTEHLHTDIDPNSHKPLLQNSYSGVRKNSHDPPDVKAEESDHEEPRAHLLNRLVIIPNALLLGARIHQDGEDENDNLLSGGLDNSLTPVASFSSDEGVRFHRNSQQIAATKNQQWKNGIVKHADFPKDTTNAEERVTFIANSNGSFQVLGETLSEKRRLKKPRLKKCWNVTPKLSSSKDFRAAKQLGIILTAFAVCWFPYFISFIVLAFCNSCVGFTVHLGFTWLGYVNSTLNPFLYPLCNMHFRRAFSKLFHCQ